MADETISLPGVVTQLQFENERLRFTIRDLEDRLSDLVQIPDMPDVRGWWSSLDSVNRYLIVVGTCVALMTLASIVRMFLIRD